MRDTIRLQRARHLIGLQSRTKNADETKASTGRIGQLWKRFVHEDVAGHVPNKVPDASVIAVYSDYESDMNGEYSLTVGCEVNALEEIPSGMTGVTIVPATYAVFPVAGSDPSAIVEAWMRVWSEFSGTPTSQRAYTTDFEEYRFGPAGARTVTIYISLT